ncbi:hypothetical protein PR048_033358 [Dryococelus australis]|uniref:DDE-1 domain-containing protein n=1 Tax=Dryococelus australis TaxID=614101 RepID=A0ABQ9G027_9NEOP|nr:hypothetical protein PR048_033358 [Dryococelus australis]
MSGKQASLLLMKKYEIIKEKDDQKTPKAEINVLSRYQPRDVYNASKLGMFYNLMPGHTLAVKGDVCKGMKRSKEHLTILMCCNMYGSDKMKPLVIGKLKNPGALGGTFFHATWMTPAVFEKNLPSSTIVPHIPSWCSCQRAPPACFSLWTRDNSAGEAEVLGNACAEVMEAIVTSWRAVQQKTIANCFRHAHFYEEAAILCVSRCCELRRPGRPTTCGRRAPTSLDSASRLTVTQPSDYDITVWGTLDYAHDVQGKQESSGEDEGEAEEPAQVLTTRDILKAGDVYAAVLKAAWCKRINVCEKITVP